MMCIASNCVINRNGRKVEKMCELAVKMFQRRRSHCWPLSEIDSFSINARDNVERIYFIAGMQCIPCTYVNYYFFFTFFPLFPSLFRRHKRLVICSEWILFFFLCHHFHTIFLKIYLLLSNEWSDWMRFHLFK